MSMFLLLEIIHSLGKNWILLYLLYNKVKSKSLSVQYRYVVHLFY